MKLIFPNLCYKEKAIKFIKEFYDYNSDINGSGALERYLEEYSYEKWIEKIVSDIDVANIPQPRVPALTYFYIREEDDEIVGMINLRLSLNDFLKLEGGHIGYCIKPTERRKHYATDMLSKALKVYEVLGINEVIISCDKCNVASANVIMNCNGELYSEIYSETFKEVIQKYIIKL